MQYILSEEEMEQVRKDRAALHKIASTDVLTSVCMNIADTMVGTENTTRWPKGGKEPYGCIHSEKSYGYCDRCPVVSICPMPKRFSK